MKKEIPLKVHTLDFPKDENIPSEAQHCILVPCWGQDFTHYYYLIDFKIRKTTFFEVNLAEYIGIFKEKMVQYHHEETCPHHMSFEQLIFWTTCPHQGEYWDGSIIISLTYANFFINIDLSRFQAFIIYDESAVEDKVYSSTNQIVDGIMYSCRWKFSDMYKEDYRNKSPIPMEIVAYDIKNDKFSIIDTISGSDQIHTTAVSPDNRYIIMIEMNVDPVISSANIQEETMERKIEILQKGLCDSTCFIYDMKQKSFSSTIIPNCPAHLVFDDKKSDVVYFSQHNMGVIRTDVCSFGPGSIIKYKISENGMLEFIKEFHNEDAIRMPGHTLFNYNGKKLIVTPVTPLQGFIIDCENMTLEKKIELRKGIKKFDFSNGPVIYPFMSMDRTPYAAQPINKTPYLYLSNVLTISIYNFGEDRYECNFRYNPGMPIIGDGHSTLFENVKLGQFHNNVIKHALDE